MLRHFIQTTEQLTFPGTNHLFVFRNPLKPDLPEGTPETIDWDFAQKELAEQSGFSTFAAGMTKGLQFKLLLFVIFQTTRLIVFI